ncbi:type IV secretory system conjugative DNA transfer family protein [Caballeronia sordidicola]|uniref:Type IV secretory pathway, VirD4 component n=1 Tax=Caballeronia sordidicola TaxID=196367 RepID=A0A242MLW9_CABSO|nr:type IV secretion system DNA-binding domain-containing protein [Caballeronia sordidicola]OTP72170.1 Type IV secretory pathway, VirD4 component [Caballeronia sordidicola]
MASLSGGHVANGAMNYGVPVRGVPQRMIEIAEKKRDERPDFSLIVKTFFFVWAVAAVLLWFLHASQFAIVGGGIIAALVLAPFIAIPLGLFVYFLVMHGYIFPLDRFWSRSMIVGVGALVAYFLLLIVMGLTGLGNQSMSLRMGLFIVVFVGFSGLLLAGFITKKSGQTLRWQGFKGRSAERVEEPPLAQSTAAVMAEATRAFEPVPIPVRPPFGLAVGTSTGTLSARGHGSGMAPNQLVVLGQPDAAQNVMIFGGIGSGKTTRLINPLLLQVLRQDAGALIFDVKTDFIRETMALADKAGRTVQVIGDGGLACNLLAGLSPETASSFIKSAFLLGSKKGGDSFWMDTATEVCRNGLGLLQHVPGQFSLTGLYDYVFDKEAHTNVHDAIDAILADGALSDRETRALKMYRRYHDNVFLEFSDDVRNGVKASIAQVLSAFQHPDLQDAFCGADSARGEVDFTDLVNKGSVYLVEIPRTKYGSEGARFAYLFVKLRFFEMMKARRMTPEWNQSRPVAFICDEYQAIADSISDPDFWDKSRSSQCVGIVSMQGYSSLIEAVGNEKSANAIAQNFRQVFTFRTEDEETIKRLVFLLGKVDREKASRSTSDSTGSSEGRERSHNQNTGSSVSVSVHHEDVINPQLFREMPEGHALAMLSLQGNAYDDVVQCQPIFVS